MTPQPPIPYPIDTFGYKRYKEVSNLFYVIFNDHTFDSVDLQDIRLSYAESILPFETGRELFNFAHRLLWISQLNQDKEYQYNEECISYLCTPIQDNEHLKITFKEVSDFYEDRRLIDIEILLTAEECYMVAQNLLYVLETSHFRNK